MRRERSDYRSAIWPVLLLATLVAWGCGSGTGEPVVEAEEVALPDVAVQLALADEFDGVVDNVVSRCPSCGLAMDGSAEHAMQFAGYELRFCSAGCLESFGADPEAGILALIIPETEPDSTETDEVPPEG